ncbi:hypothetical protein BV898_09654 [Hypsibius exemplaris]|uniref:Uncharacterized protein n=1 Tax=Hypsibius exemplaris TaxID=2072580 RepID=A0A1W0WLU5_HYPEX|nr:hypothetical protein BV898_09654 [Hypsibius exemplaris]
MSEKEAVDVDSAAPEPDLLDAFFAEIANAEAQASGSPDKALPTEIESTPKSPIEPDAMSGESVKVEDSLEPSSKNSPLTENVPEKVVSPEVSPRSSDSIVMMPDEAKDVVPETTHPGAASEIDTTTVTTEGEIPYEAAENIPESPASPPSHDFSIEDLLSQDGDHPKMMPIPAEEPVFKRPVSPNRIAVVEDVPAQSRSEDSQSAPAGGALRVRKEPRVAPHHPVQKCFLSQQKRKRPETESGLLAAILGNLRSPMGKLLIPDSVLVDYLDEAGVDVVADAKVPRLLGVAAEHHTANIIQDVFQIYVDGQQDRKRNGKERDGGAVSRPEKKDRPKAKMGRPLSAASSKDMKKKGQNYKEKKRKKHAYPEDLPSSTADSPMDLDQEHVGGANSHYDEDGDPRSSNPIHNGERMEHLRSDGPPFSIASQEAMEMDADRSEVRSVISKDERESERATGGGGGRKESKRDREKDAAEKRNILTLDLLAPVLREQGYHLGNAPYFVN